MLISRPGGNRRSGEFHAGRLAAVGGVCGRSLRSFGFPLLPLVAESMDIRPLLSDPLPLSLVDGLKPPRIGPAPCALIERLAYDVAHQ